MKYTLCFLALFATNIVSVATAQINATSLTIEYAGIKLRETCYSPDDSLTFVASRRYYHFPGMAVKDTSITTDGSYPGCHGGYRNVKLDIEIDTVLKKITQLNFTDDFYASNFSGSPYNWHRDGEYIQANNVIYRVSKTMDSLIAMWDSAQIRSSNLSIYISDENGGPWSSRRCYSGYYDVSKDGYFKVTIVGKFPLAVFSPTNNKNESITINSSAKILIISSQQRLQTQSISCYDILGRKHSLEFLGSDDNSGNYSVRSLPVGVYFVSCGKEMLKFMITE